MGQRTSHTPTMHHLLLFDIDGTLLNTRGAGRRSMEDVANQMFGPHFTFDDISFSGRLDPSLFAEAAARHKLDDHDRHHDAFRAAYLTALESSLADRSAIQVLPGVPHLLAHLRQRRDDADDIMLGLLSGNYALAAPIKLAAARIDSDWFEITAFGDEGNTRPDLVALAMERYRQKTGYFPDPQHVVVIGDTPLDVECAKAHGCTAVAVATGRFSVNDLHATDADLVLPDLADPRPLLEILT